jgi:hypothetical protein
LKKINDEIIGSAKKQLVKKRPNVQTSAIFLFFLVKNPFKKDDMKPKNFLQDLGLLIMKNNLPLQFVESVWLMSQP